MFKSIFTVSIMSLGLLAAAPAMANDYHSRHDDSFRVRIAPPPQHCIPGYIVNNMQANQRNSIQEGKRQGDLTNSEITRLYAKLDHIAREERQARRDGCMTPRERDTLVRMLEQNARNIWQERNDNERRGNGGRNHRNDHNDNHRNDRNDHHH